MLVNPIINKFQQLRLHGVPGANRRNFRGSIR